MKTTKTTKKQESILQFLQQHPEFLLENAQLLGVRPIDSKIRSFSEAQLAFAEKEINTIAHHMAVMTENTAHNVHILKTIIDLATQLACSLSINQTLEIISGCLKDGFSLDDFVCLLLIDPYQKKRLPQGFRLPETHAAYAKLKALTTPVSGTRLLHRSLNEMLSKNHENESYLHLPIRFADKTIGALIIGHPDPCHFPKDAETEYVALMGELIGAAWVRILGGNPLIFEYLDKGTLK